MRLPDRCQMTCAQELATPVGTAGLPRESRVRRSITQGEKDMSLSTTARPEMTDCYLCGHEILEGQEGSPWPFQEGVYLSIARKHSKPPVDDYSWQHFNTADHLPT